MANRIAERLVWAVEMLQVAPDDQLLEIGCGAGLAVSLICERLVSGTITAIDRSEAMIRQARGRNREHIAAGKAQFQALDLEAARLGDVPFTKVFAFNIGLFTQQPASALQIIKTHLLPGGALYLFHQPPMAGKTQQIAERVARNLETNGFSIREVSYKNLYPAPAVCLIADV